MSAILAPIRLFHRAPLGSWVVGTPTMCPLNATARLNDEDSLRAMLEIWRSHALSELRDTVCYERELQALSRTFQQSTVGTRSWTDRNIIVDFV